jgi:hypothetical protein
MHRRKEGREGRYERETKGVEKKEGRERAKKRTKIMRI